MELEPHKFKCSPSVMSNFEWPYLRSGFSDPLHVSLQSRVFGVGGSNGAISGTIKSEMAAMTRYDMTY